MEIAAENFRPPPDFSQRIKTLRNRLGLSQQQLADLFTVSSATVKLWEQGRLYPSQRDWQRIALAEVEGVQSLPGTSHKQKTLHETANGYNLSERITPSLDFTSTAEVVRVVVEGERLTYGHLFNPAFATEISMIEPLPHQRLAVYEHMLKQNRLRFMLADDAGAGKTIMTGLYIREMLTRRLISRVLIVPPAGLVGNWEHEMRHLFNLSFRIVSGGDARASNPFTATESDLLIVSIDTLRGDAMFARLQEPDVLPYDLVIFDEAHKLAADREPDLRFRKTDRYRLAETLAGIPSEEPRWTLTWSCHHLLLLTATPHMGKDYPYYCLWRLLEPDALASIDAFNGYPPEARRQHFIRRTKEELVYYDGKPIYPPRYSNTLSYDLQTGEVSEQHLYDETTSYIQTYYNRAEVFNRSAARLAMSVFQRRLASSTYALLRSFERRQQKLPPPPLAAKDVIPDNLPEAWNDNQQTTARNIADALSTKAGKALPWLIVRDALTAAFNARYVERVGPWPSDYAGARTVIVARRTEQAPQQPSKPADNDTTVTMQKNGSGSTPVAPVASIPGTLAAHATLSVAEMQDLVEQIAALTKASIDSFGVHPTFSLRIEVHPKSAATVEQIQKVNKILEEVSPTLKLG